MSTYTALIDADHAITVIVSDDAGDRQALPATPLSTSSDDLRAHAERFLGMEGWHLAGTWEAGEGELRAPVRRGPRVGDPGMRDAIIESTAKYILRGDAHTKKPAHSEAQILAHVRYEFRGAEADGYIFPEDTPEQIAANAGELARWQQDHNVNWQDWAFGH